MRVVYMGTPRFAVPTLEAILKAGHEVAAVLTQPDRPKGRHQQLTPSPVKECAQAHNLRIEQPERVRRPEVLTMLAAIEADVMVVVGYGQIIPQSIIDLPRHGIVNVHASLLPKYRGAGPIQWAIANGETVTGVTTMRIDAGLDTGDIFLMRETPIGPRENAVELGNRLAVMGAELLVETLDRLAAGTLSPQPQNHAEATLAPILTRDDARIDWHRWTAHQIDCRVRGFYPWPGCSTTFRNQNLQVWQALPAGDGPPLEPGVMAASSGRLYVGCSEGPPLEILEVQLEGRKRMAAPAFINGQRLLELEVLGRQQD